MHVKYSHNANVDVGIINERSMIVCILGVVAIIAIAVFMIATHRTAEYQPIVSRSEVVNGGVAVDNAISNRVRTVSRNCRSSGASVTEIHDRLAEIDGCLDSLSINIGTGRRELRWYSNEGHRELFRIATNLTATGNRIDELSYEISRTNRELAELFRHAGSIPSGPVSDKLLATISQISQENERYVTDHAKLRSHKQLLERRSSNITSIVRDIEALLIEADSIQERIDHVRSVIRNELASPAARRTLARLDRQRNSLLEDARDLAMAI